MLDVEEHVLGDEVLEPAALRPADVVMVVRGARCGPAGGR
jgi:hypothetical protein